MTLTFRLALLSALLLASPFAARADWTGTLRIRTDPKPVHGEDEQDGTISGSGTKMRMDTTRARAGKISMIVDLAAHKSIMILDNQRAFMTMDLDRLQGRAPLGGLHCDGSDVAACLKNAGFTKSGVEAVNGRKSDRWESDRVGAHGEKIHETLWVPQGVKGFAMIKQVTQSPGRTMTLDVLDFKEGSVPASQFEAPAGYTDMTGRMGPGPGMGPPGSRGPQGPQSLPPNP